MKKHIPNTLTCLNLFSGCIGVLFALEGEFLYVFYCILASGIFDFFDGMVARALHVKSNIGKELDSLADMVSFGFLPGTILFMLFKEASDAAYLPYIAFLVTVFSALRLAKFNIDERQTTDFIGLNTPMNTFFIISLPFIAQQYPQLVYNVPVLLVITVGTSLLLVSEIKLFSMKLTTMAWYPNRFKYIFLMISVLLLIVFKFVALPFVLLIYIVMSLLHFAQEKAVK
ncbi:CDP-diacylglycerol--serine O-phosphatidyltransferase [Sphingobacterium psychroaquaticum]|uniref:CDP-diacylglycerol--serine O-phosphatidyltransferase n=1 Tax=Sphingobacterium psychroaquaticum TaxID=561061 RepID=A0A1X7HZ47_9SPHI|nr:CDP-diacylglycerol--serine O-phosphatidyltransferase [Sphingobacterium psychroaquaticum]QBQ42182.1 CDP-diacylglycerol--serine O-phosphatidyltransferase [Sphingobacterium psychroaquaticum]SMG07170.1 CDP-diacylglycerol---serine O-phosphatidyltransferase [Sphingobacterium psychroaquaticum]